MEWVVDLFNFHFVGVALAGLVVIGSVFLGYRVGKVGRVDEDEDGRREDYNKLLEVEERFNAQREELIQRLTSREVPHPQEGKSLGDLARAYIERQEAFPKMRFDIGTLPSQIEEQERVQRRDEKEREEDDQKDVLSQETRESFEEELVSLERSSFNY